MIANAITGRNAWIGERVIRAGWRPAALEDGLHDPERGSDREDVHDCRLEGDQQGAEDDQQQQRRERDHDPDEVRKLA